MPKNSMNWKRLKDFKCPKCDADLEKNGGLFACCNNRCDFIVSHEKFKSLVEKMYEKRENPVDETARNQALLNQL